MSFDNFFVFLNMWVKTLNDTHFETEKVNIFSNLKRNCIFKDIFLYLETKF